MHDAVRVDVGVDEPELDLVHAVGEQPLPTAQRDRIDEQVQLVHEAIGEQSLDKPSAAADVDRAVDVRLELLDGGRVVRSDHGGVGPLDAR